MTVSYFEWLQNLKGEKWNKTKVRNKLKPIMIKTFKETDKLAKIYKTDLRTDAFMVALKKILK